jgi:hypothetical protein
MVHKVAMEARAKTLRLTPPQKWLTSEVGGLALRRVKMKLRAKVQAAADPSSQIVSTCIDVVRLFTRARH